MVVTSEAGKGLPEMRGRKILITEKNNIKEEKMREVGDKRKKQFKNWSV